MANPDRCVVCGDPLNRRNRCDGCEQYTAARTKTLTTELAQWDRITAAANEADIREWNRQNR